MSDRLALMESGRIVQIGSPREVYDYPANEFIADFLGDTNIFRGRIVELDESRVLVRLPDMSVIHAIPAATRHHEAPLKENMNVNVSIRPQKVSITGGVSQSSKSQNSFEGVIEEIEYVGAYIRYHAKLTAGSSMVVEQVLRDVTTKNVGDRVVLACAVEDCLVLPLNE